MFVFYFHTAGPNVKKYEKKRKYEKIDLRDFVNKSRETPHAFGMVNKIIAYTKFIRIGYLCCVLF